MMFWMIAIASVLALPTLFRWRGWLVYKALLIYASFGLVGLAVHDLFRPSYTGSPGDALGVAIVVLFTVMLIAGLLLTTLIRMLVVGTHRRLRRSPPPHLPPDC